MWGVSVIDDRFNLTGLKQTAPFIEIQNLGAIISGTKKSLVSSRSCSGDFGEIPIDHPPNFHQFTEKNLIFHERYKY